MGNYRTIATDADMPQEAKDAPVMSPLGMQWVGINGGITPRRGDAPKGGEPVNAFVCVIGVDNIDLYIEKVKTAGGTIAVDKMKVPGVGDLAYAKDLEGNIFGMLQPDMTMEKK
jgi:predicted enzyme related to lactoylglutathione lyase